MGWNLGESKRFQMDAAVPCRGAALVCTQHCQHRQLPLPAAGGSGSLSIAHCTLWWALPASSIHPVSSSTGCCAKDEAEVSLPPCTMASAPRWGTGHFPAFCGASLSGFNYICGLDGFAWPLKSISQRVVLKWARNICGSCGFPPGLQEG